MVFLGKGSVTLKFYQESIALGQMWILGMIEPVDNALKTIKDVNDILR